MAPDSITRRPNDRARPRALQFLFDSRLGQIFSLLILLKLVDTFIIELPLGGIVTLALWVYALAFLFRLVARLRGKLLWKIRRKLFIS